MQQQPIGALLNDRYRIRDILGQGGIGTVYLAEHVQLDTPIALKEVLEQNLAATHGTDALEQCRREGRLLVRLNHPNLPKVTDAFIENSGFYLAMEYVEGMTAEDCLREVQGGQLPLTDVLEWGIQIATVLDYLHSQRPPIIFRDLKPNNIIVQPNGIVKLVDFGIARRFNPNSQNDTIRLGSVGFSPPEQFGLQQTDQRSDLYSLGATLHHLLTGYDPSLKPFRFPPAAQLNPTIPIALSELLDRCVALETTNRPADAREVRRELGAIRDGIAAPALTMPTLTMPTLTMPTPPPPPQAEPIPALERPVSATQAFPTPTPPPQAEPSPAAPTPAPKIVGKGPSRGGQAPVATPSAVQEAMKVLHLHWERHQREERMKRALLYAGAPALLLVVLYVLAWSIPGKRRPLSVPALDQHTAYLPQSTPPLPAEATSLNTPILDRHTASPEMPPPASSHKTYLPISALPPATAWRLETGTAHARTDDRIAIRHHRESVASNQDSLPARRHKRRSNPDSAAQQKPRRDQAPAPIAAQSHELSRRKQAKPAAHPPSGRGEKFPADQLHDTDLETVLDADKK